MGDISEGSLLDYIYSSGGKVKNSDLLKTYKQFISHNDLQLRAKYREEFKQIIDRIAVMKSENGEKYLVLKKKYRQLMQERQSEPQPAAGLLEGTGDSPDTVPRRELRVLGTDLQQGSLGSQAEDRGKPATLSGCAGPTITVTEAQEIIEEELQTDGAPSWSGQENPCPPEEPSEPNDGDEDLDKDSGSKSGSEQDEEGMGSVGSASVALDPIEKEWICSSAGCRLSHLSLLLRQDSSLVNKKDFTSGFTALHWAAKHGREDMANLVAEAGADVNTRAHGYTPLHIAALHGHKHIMELLVGTYGAKENVRDYSGHLASHYLSIRDTPEEESELQVPEYPGAQVSERRNRKLASLFHSKKKWGSAEELAPVPEERAVPHQLMIPAFRPRKFSR